MIAMKQIVKSAISAKRSKMKTLKWQSITRQSKSKKNVISNASLKAEMIMTGTKKTCMGLTP